MTACGPNVCHVVLTQVVNDPQLFEEWKSEMKGMAGRIERVRGELRR